MIRHSAVYEGLVRHRRFQPIAHSFRMPICMLYLDLDEFDEAMDTSLSLSAEHAAPLRFAREDYLGPAELPLREAVHRRVEAAIGRSAGGPIRMLTHPRHFGYVFNPVTFYYCFDRAGAAVEAIVAEITNTPWMERHAYVLDARASRRRGDGRAWQFRKDFHVSPLLPMDIDYDWTFTTPTDRLGVQMVLSRRGARCFDATLTMRRRDWTAPALRRMVTTYPLMTAQIIARIHWEALRLWLKGARVFPHPGARGRGIAGQAVSRASDEGAEGESIG